MNFDVFDDIEFDRKDQLLRNCKAAERYIIVSPFISVAHARAALEILCKGMIKEHAVKQIIPSGDGKPGNPNLATMIATCVKNGIITKTEDAAVIRKNGNDALHINKGSQKIQVVNEKSVKKAMDSVEALFHVFQDVFHTHTDIDFDKLKVPFGFFEIVRAVPKAPNEVIFGEFNYFVKDPQENYYYLQIYHRNSEEEIGNTLGERGMLAGNRIKGNKGRTSYLLDVYYPSNLLAESDREYIAYSVYNDSCLLSEMQGGQLTDKQVVMIALDITNALLELESIGEGIHLRNLQPGNVIITPNADGYMAGVVNMETAKITGYEATVIGSMRELITQNPYMPRELRNFAENGPLDINWEKVDVYSLGKIMVYCKDPSLVKEEIDDSVLYDIFPDEIADILYDIFTSSINMIYSPMELKEKLQDVVDQY
ncbi:MAG: DUF4145 domain-containing protein [Butyrivibrio sp.]|uniref:DUF4145 domain-containing protein n=1 Tax=Butyrivibrio sp. TaxID=28121 RepID=UPI001B627465|nr:DUF4145 domain-containing protein [Butyrivibrio sp.]MBP3783223.1 DUF4145 domain-containing protein [Butyrivibrio sp.]